jgi:signal transduction histidine kinase
MSEITEITRKKKKKLLRNDRRFLMGLLGITRDFTESKALEIQKSRIQKKMSLELMVGGIAHDLNNLLFSILGNVEMLELENLTEGHKKLLKNVKDATMRGKDLTAQLLSFPTGGTSKKSISSVNTIVSDSASLVLRSVKITYDIKSPKEELYINADVGQINQVINNLLINAVQAMPNGGNISINYSKIEHGNQVTATMEDITYVKIAIQDTGVGIPKKLHQKLFCPYFTTKENGTGLGLTSCFHIIKDHKGYITFESEEGRGTTFFLYLPLSPNQQI